MLGIRRKAIVSNELERLHAENAEKALAESEIVKADIRRRMERILKRMQASGEIRQGVTVDDLLREDAP